MARLRVKTPGLWGVGSEIRDLPLFRNYGDIPVIDQDQIATVHRRPPPPAKLAAENAGKTYEEERWAYLSPAFRAAHNRLRQQRGLPTISPPKIDFYVPPPPQTARAADPVEATAAARSFLGHSLMAGGDEGFAIQGNRVTDAQLARKAQLPSRRMTTEGLNKVDWGIEFDTSTA
jgi:hypothetical protein